MAPTSAITSMAKLTRRQRRFLAAMYPDGTVSTGTETGRALHHMGFIHVAKWGRYGLTPEGKTEFEKYPESKWDISKRGNRV